MLLISINSTHDDGTMIVASSAKNGKNSRYIHTELSSASGAIHWINYFNFEMFLRFTGLIGAQNASIDEAFCEGISGSCAAVP